MRLVVVGGVVTLLSVLGLRAAFRVDGPYREYCSTLSVSPDDRFQLESWQATSLDPLSRQLDMFGSDCSRDGWVVMRETSTGDRIAETESHDLWMFDRYRDVDSELVIWEPRAAIAGSVYSSGDKVELPPGIASIAVPTQGRKCDEVSVSPDGRFRLEVWSRHRPLGCLVNQGPGEVLLIEQATERLVGKTTTSSVLTPFGNVDWSAHQVKFDVNHEDAAYAAGTREQLSLDD